MPTSILEDSASLKHRGKTTLGLLFVLGIVLLMYLMTKTNDLVDELKSERAEETTAEIFKSKPEELSFIIPTPKEPKTKTEREERTKKAIEEIKKWEEKISLYNPSKKIESVRDLVVACVQEGLIHHLEGRTFLGETKILKIVKTDDEWGVKSDE
jgi:hypothetical protein